MSSILVLIAAVAFLWIVAEHVHLARAVKRERPRPPAPGRYPSLTVIRPIRGVDVDAAENVRALLASDYPAPLEILFIFDDETDPAVSVVREVLAASVLRDSVTARVLKACAGAAPGRTICAFRATGGGDRAVRRLQ